MDARVARFVLYCDQMHIEHAALVVDKHDGRS